MDAMGATDEDAIFVRDTSGNLLGWVQFIYGNEADGSEVISDYTDNRYISRLVGDDDAPEFPHGEFPSAAEVSNPIEPPSVWPDRKSVV